MAIVARKNKHGNISYMVRVKDAQNKWFRAETFSDELAARDRENQLQKMTRKGGTALSDDAKLITLDEYWEVWSKENRSSVSEGWKKSQDQMYRDYILPVLGNLKMISIKAPEIGRVLNRAQTAGLGDQTRKHIYSLLRKMFNDAVEYYEMLATNPVRARFHRPQVSERKRDFLVPRQAWQLLEFTRNHYLGPAIWLQVLAGLRPSEVQAMRGRSLIFDLNQILICAAYNNKMNCMQDYPKQEDWAYAPMPPQLKEYLMTLQIGPDDFVAKSNQGKMLPYPTYIVALKKICEEAGVPQVTPHELRHTCTEIYVQAGASAEDIRRLLNHSGFTATKHYIHRTDERLNSIAGSISPLGFTINFTKNSTNVKNDTSSNTKRSTDYVQ